MSSASPPFGQAQLVTFRPVAQTGSEISRIELDQDTESIFAFARIAPSPIDDYLTHHNVGQPGSIISPSVYRLPHGFVLGASHLIASSDFSAPIEGIVINPQNPSKYFGAEDSSRLWLDGAGLHFTYDAEQDHEAGFFLGAHPNFGHWLLNHLSRLGLKHAVPALREIPVVVPDTLTPTQMECLRVAGYTSERIIIARARTLHRFRVLYTATTGWYRDFANSWWFADGNVDFLRCLFLSPADPVFPRSRVYISRRHAAWRRVVNETDVIDSLRPLGFRVIFPEQMSIDEQIDVARTAEIIVGPMGAGNNLSIFGPTNSAVIELRPHIRARKLLMTGHVCRLSGQRFDSVIGESRPSPGQVEHDFDFAVDPKTLVNKIEALL